MVKFVELYETVIVGELKIKKCIFWNMHVDIYFVCVLS